jgi:hypothetical protein
MTVGDERLNAQMGTEESISSIKIFLPKLSNIKQLYLPDIDESYGGFCFDFDIFY